MSDRVPLHSSGKTYLPLVSQAVGFSLLSHSLLVEVTEFQVIVDFKTLLAASSWVCHVDLQRI